MLLSLLVHVLLQIKSRTWYRVLPITFNYCMKILSTHQTHTEHFSYNPHQMSTALCVRHPAQLYTPTIIIRTYSVLGSGELVKDTKQIGLWRLVWSHSRRVDCGLWTRLDTLRPTNINEMISCYTNTYAHI